VGAGGILESLFRVIMEGVGIVVGFRAQLQ